MEADLIAGQREPRRQPPAPVDVPAQGRQAPAARAARIGSGALGVLALPAAVVAIGIGLTVRVVHDTAVPVGQTSSPSASTSPAGGSTPPAPRATPTATAAAVPTPGTTVVGATDLLSGRQGWSGDLNSLELDNGRVGLSTRSVNQASATYDPSVTQKWTAFSASAVLDVLGSGGKATLIVGPRSSTPITVTVGSSTMLVRVPGTSDRTLALPTRAARRLQLLLAGGQLHIDSDGTVLDVPAGSAAGIGVRLDAGTVGGPLVDGLLVLRG